MAYGGSVNTDILSDETSDLLCNVCERNGKNREAEKYCAECDDHYCSMCVKVHEKISILMGHKIFDKTQFPSGSNNKQATTKPGSSTEYSSTKPGSSPKEQPPAPTEKCGRHGHHYIDMYCQNHDDVGCGTCMAIDHRLCQDIFYIPEFLQNNHGTTGAEESKHDLESTLKTLKVHHENLIFEKQRLQTRKAESLMDIRRFRKEINNVLDALEQSTLAYVEERYKHLIISIEESIKLLNKEKAEVTLARDKLADKIKKLSQRFADAKKGKQVVHRASKCLEDNKTLTATNDIAFVADQKIPALLQEMNALGKIRHKNTAATEISEERKQAGMNQKHSVADISEQREPLLQVKGSHSHSVTVKSDRTICDIVSACTMEDGTIILSDNTNNKLKRLDSSTFTVTDYCDLPGAPWQVCPINMQLLAVCLLYNKQVAFITVSNSMTVTNKINTNFKCYGLAYAGGNLYISDYERSVYIYSLSGKKLKQLRKYQLGQTMFSYIRSLAVNEDGSRIYVSDLDKGLIVLDSNGQAVGKFSGSQQLE